MAELLRIRNLEVRFDPDVQAVRDASLSVEEGSFTSIVGESGSGKSVTALSVCRLERSSAISGEILYRDQNLLPLSEKELRRFRGKEIAYVFQDHASSLNPVLRAGVQIDETYRAHFGHDGDGARRATLRALEAVKIADPERVYASYPHELSGGMRQRVMIAAALATGSRLLIADEPTTALDVTTEAEVLALLRAAQEEKNLTVLFITHNLPLAARHSDAIYVMEKGRTVERMGRTSGVFSPSTPYARMLFAAGGLEKAAPKTFLKV